MHSLHSLFYILPQKCFFCQKNREKIVNPLPEIVSICELSVSLRPWYLVKCPVFSSYHSIYCIAITKDIAFFKYLFVPVRCLAA